MTMLVSLAALVLIAVGSTVLLSLLRSVQDWTQRRSVQLALLLLPLLLLLLPLCMLGLTIKHVAFVHIFFVGIALIGSGAFVLALLRLLLLHWVMRRQLRRSLRGTAALRMTITHLAQRAALSSARIPQLRLLLSQRPMAFTYGFWHPTVVLSSWMVEHLDTQEVEAVLAHELAHVARYDACFSWLALLLRDAFWYLPTSWLAYRQLQHEQELACDEQVAVLTQRPLALASALTKVWLQTVDDAPLVKTPGIQHLLASPPAMQERIERLMAFRATKHVNNAVSLERSWFPRLTFSVLCTLYGTYGVLVLAIIGCSPSIVLGRLL